MLCYIPWWPSGISGSNSTTTCLKLNCFCFSMLRSWHHGTIQTTTGQAGQQGRPPIICSWLSIIEKSIIKFKRTGPLKSLFSLWLQILDISYNRAFLFLQFVYMYIIIYPFSLQSNVLLCGRSVLQIFCVLFSWFQEKFKRKVKFYDWCKNLSLKVERAKGTGRLTESAKSPVKHFEQWPISLISMRAELVQIVLGHQYPLWAWQEKNDVTRFTNLIPFSRLTHSK